MTTREILEIIIPVELRVVGTDIDRYRLVGMLLTESAYHFYILLVVVEKATTLERGIVAATDVNAQTNAYRRGLRFVSCHIEDIRSLLLNGLVEGKELEDLRLVLQEEVVPTGIPTSYL